MSTIDNPVINSPFAKPQRHYLFTETGITNQRIAGRRKSLYFVPVPTIDQIRNSSTKEIACWFIDSNYNEESLFVRQAYFTRDDKPYDKLKRVLKAEINEDAWTQLYSTKSRRFDPPQTGKIAVKVINHYGDEVLKVFEV